MHPWLANVTDKWCVCLFVGVACGSNHSCFLSDRGVVYSCGERYYTGHGSAADDLVPKEVAGPLTDVDVRAITAGSFHTLALSSSARVYSWGHNRVGQLGFTCEGATPSTKVILDADGGVYTERPLLVDTAPHHVTRISAGWGHSALVTESGHLYTCGRNKEAQLGLGDPAAFPVNEQGTPYCAQFTRVEGALLGKVVTQVACGGGHTVALCADHELYGMGDNALGQYDTSRYASITVSHAPRLLSFFKEESWVVKSITSAHDFVAFVVGKREPHTLRTICADYIKASPDIMQFVDRKREREEADGAEDRPAGVEGDITSSSGEKDEEMSADHTDVIRNLLR